MLSIRLTVPCKETWRKLHIEVQKSLKTALKKLARGELQGKELTKELGGYSSLTVNNHRAIYKVLNDRILVFHVGHRSNVSLDTKQLRTSTESSSLEPI